MNCAEFQEIVHELARRNAREILGEPLTVRAHFHAEMCEGCAARFAQAQVVARALEIHAQNSESLEAPAELEARLLAAFREQRSARKSPSRFQSFWASAGRYERAALAAAAALFLVFGMWNLSHRREISGKTSGTVVSNVSPQSLVAQKLQTASPANSLAIESATAASNDFSGFVAVPYEPGFSSAESGVIVRVEMPRSALARLGYPVDVTRGSEMVRADVMVGDDGWPRAVRVLQ